ncbi:hypothetical protein MMC07_001061 [Pseudocyphellaria aurata]|nr:hypothetical protein [Pseudocyphellaria aurata]
MTEPNDQPVVIAATSENEAVANVTPARAPRGLLDLPAEVRVMILRHILVSPLSFNFNFGTWASGPQPVNILRTCRLIHREAFQILYAENHFSNCLGYSHCCLTRFPRVMRTIQNIRLDLPMFIKDQAYQKFWILMRHFGNPRISRGTLTLGFDLDGSGARRLKWFARALGRFTNFRTIEVYCYHRFKYNDLILRALKYFRAVLEPVLGSAEDTLPDTGLRFHPVNLWNRRREQCQIDWADSLDGICLE